jgi:hypothetical protein
MGAAKETVFTLLKFKLNVNNDKWKLYIHIYCKKSVNEPSARTKEKALTPFVCLLKK